MQPYKQARLSLLLTSRLLCFWYFPNDVAVDVEEREIWKVVNIIVIFVWGKHIWGQNVVQQFMKN